MTDLPRFEHKMSDAEALMWRVENDPHLSSTFANITILDSRPDLDRLRRRMERVIHAVPRLRQRVQSAPANLTSPIWVDDPDFDLNYHIRHLALPKPGNMRQLLDLASHIACDPFDRTRPLWQFVVVDGLRGAKSALIEKLHHAIVDGEAGVALSLQFLDLERHPSELPPLDPDLIAAAEEARAEQAPGPDLLRELLSGSMRMPLGLLKHVKGLLADPTAIPEAGSSAADTVRTIVQQLNDTDSARSPLWTQRSLRRRIDVLRTPFEATRNAARRLGGTVNIALLTCAAEAAGDYHRQLGAPVDELRASMAISTRSEASGANAFSLARMMVPTGEMPIGERFVTIQGAADAAKATSASASLETIATVATGLPTGLITRIARQQAHTVDFATSNVHGSPVPLFLAGAQLMENYPVGPLGGVAYNLTLLSYNHSLDMGINTDAAAVTEPDLMRACMKRAFKSLNSA